MKPMRAVTRRLLDQRMIGMEQKVGPRPARGWIKAIREALGMSASELAERMGVSLTRVRQIEQGEMGGSILLSTIERAAEALNCRFCYVLVPDEPLEDMVRRQALAKAAEKTASSMPEVAPEHRGLLTEAVSEQVEALASVLVDSRGLWRAPDTTNGGRGDRASGTMHSDTTSTAS